MFHNISHCLRKALCYPRAPSSCSSTSTDSNLDLSDSETGRPPEQPMRRRVTQVVVQKKSQGDSKKAARQTKNSAGQNTKKTTKYAQKDIKEQEQRPAQGPLPPLKKRKIGIDSPVTDLTTSPAPSITTLSSTITIDSSHSSDTRPIAFFGDFAVSEQDLQTLKESEWLNDNIINAGLAILEDRYMQRTSQSCYCVNALLTPGFVKEVTKRHSFTVPEYIDVQNFLADRVLWPCNTGNHWFLVVVDNKRQSVTCMDSLSTRKSLRWAGYIQTWHQKLLELNNLQEQAHKVARYPVQSLAIPEQSNYDDCGVALLWAAERIFHGEDTGQKSDPPPYPTHRGYLQRLFREGPPEPKRRRPRLK